MVHEEIDVAQNNRGIDAIISDTRTGDAGSQGSRMIDLDLLITVDEVKVILEDLENEELLTHGQAEVILRELLQEVSDGTTRLRALMEILLNRCGINLVALYGKDGDVDVDHLRLEQPEKGQIVEMSRKAPTL